jgi:site-specific recombinase XerD
VKGYLDKAHQFLDFLQKTGMPTEVSLLTREHVESFLVAKSEDVSASTVATCYRYLQQLFRWLLDEGEIIRSPMERMHPPHVPEKPVPVIESGDLRRLLAACAGTDFTDRRDLAIITLLLDTGVRLAELGGLALTDVDFGMNVVVVMGKGRRLRSCPFGAKAAQTLDRYLRARAHHPYAELDALWLSPKGRLTDSGIAQMIERRCIAAELPRLNPHRFRHTFAHEWLAAGGGEGDLCGSLAGGRGTCWTAMRRRRRPSEPERHIGACRRPIGCDARRGASPRTSDAPSAGQPHRATSRRP